MQRHSFPKWEDLPELVPGFHCSWEYFNSLAGNVQKDQLGTLNFLSQERKAKAAREELLTGESVCLELPIDFLGKDTSAFGGRPEPVHDLKKVAPFCYEDNITFNTQASSQWDGLRHFAIRSANLFYNGYRASDFKTSDVLGIHKWLENGGIAGRGVLVDYCHWATNAGKSLDVNGGTKITLGDVKQILESQGTTVHPGDILVFRTGWLEWYQATEPKARHHNLCVENEPGKHRFIGLAQEPEFVAWLWQNQIAAVAGDQPAFESTPPPSEGFGWLHEHLLGALGCPIGELWNTESLAKACRSNGRYSFFLASSPLALRGGAASTTNAMAIF
ncbi:hypothetical protein N7474_006957 [Penicillium riverlandense]|uniref:uncharacterized protein n=1 Tax=Penicillium riverlandense TaxID=1903569 RepID=UPI00254917CE|nr:uncharacterized protein N7474_006957 [Penicillium riverlandense]KAJ5815180.1 hypothetical protein N7474_006957 [Penicillium riverlandense]